MGGDTPQPRKVNIMNESHFTFSIDGKLYSKWAESWGAIKAEHSTAILIMQSS